MYFEYEEFPELVPQQFIIGDKHVSNYQIGVALDFFIRTRRWSRILSFALFFCILAASLGGGNLFLDYTQALQHDLQAAKFMRPRPTQDVYQPLFAAFQPEIKNIRSASQEVAASTPVYPEKKVGVYLHMNNTANPEVLEAEIERLQKFQNSALIFDVKGSFVYFPTSSPIAQKHDLIKPLYELPDIIAQMKEAGIYTIARVISLKDDVYSHQNPEVKLWNKDKSGHAVHWVNPQNSEVLDYNREIISEIVEAGVDEINLDFIRYPTKFTSAFLGITNEEKAEHVSNFVSMVRQSIDQKNPKTVLSVNTFAILGWDQDGNAGLGQDVQELAQIADIIAPMLYPNTFSKDNANYHLKGKSFEYSTVYRTLEKYAELLGTNAVKLRPWIQGYYTYTEDMIDQIQAVYDAGVCGFTIWDIHNDYYYSYRAMEMVELPEECLKTLS